MRIEYHLLNETKIAEIISDDLLIKNTQDALDIMIDIYYQDIGKIILHENNLATEFFDLKSGLAGDILQKFSNYRVQLAIIGDFSKYKSKSLNNFINESNQHRQINFVSSINEAIEKLKK